MRSFLMVGLFVTSGLCLGDEDGPKDDRLKPVNASEAQRLYSSRITDQSLKILGRLPNLERLTFEHCTQITNAGLAALATLPRLREVRLEGSPLVTREGAMMFPTHVRVSYEG